MDRAPAAVNLGHNFRFAIQQARNFDLVRGGQESVRLVFFNVEYTVNNNPRGASTKDLEIVQGIHNICEWILEFYKEEAGADKHLYGGHDKPSGYIDYGPGKEEEDE